MRATLRVALSLAGCAAVACGSKAPPPLQCAVDELFCSGACVKFLTSSSNCGACNNLCAATATCQNGSCVTPDGGSDAGPEGGNDGGVISAAVCVPTVQAAGVNATTVSIDIALVADGGCALPVAFDLTVAVLDADGGVVYDLEEILTARHGQVPALVVGKPYVFAASGTAADGTTKSALSPYTTPPLTLVATPAPPTSVTLIATTTDSVVLGFLAPTGQALPFAMLPEVDHGTGFAVGTAVFQDSSVIQIKLDPTFTAWQARLRTQLSNGELSDPSNAVTITLGPGPTAPGNLTADAGVHSVWLAWTPPADAGQADASIVSYEIDTSHDSTTWALAGSADGTATSSLITFSQADAGIFSFRVTAANQFGSGPPSNVVTGRPLFPPTAPAGLVTRAGTNQLSLRWRAGLDFAGAVASSYDIYLADAGPGPIDQFVATVDAGFAIIPALENGKIYRGGIVARNADGTSGAVVHFTPVVPAPWSEPVLTLGTQNKGAAFLDAGVAVFGGLTGGVVAGPASTQSYLGAFDFDGSVSSWRVAANLIRPLANMASIGVQTNAGTAVYALGGLGSDGGSSLSTLFDVPEAQALLNPVFADGGSDGPWAFQAPSPPPQARHDYGVASTATDVYLVGGIDTSGTAYNDIQHASVSAGVLSGFATLPITLTTPRYGVASVAYNGYLYVIGGNQLIDGGPVVADVLFAPINQADGTLGSTFTSTTSLPGPRFLAGAAAWNGRLYVTSGTTDITGSNGVTALKEVLIGSINPLDGTISSWTSNAALLPASNGSYGYVRAPAMIANGYLSIYGRQYQALGHIDPITGTIGNPDGGTLPP